MSERTKKLHIWLSIEEDLRLNRMARQLCIPKASVARMALATTATGLGIELEPALGE